MVVRHKIGVSLRSQEKGITLVSFFFKFTVKAYVVSI